ncbi:hypothetical protein J6590_002033 [Homalodisca vitripennis]|nr:hypothetical protein J6590_002033 [Homalodisca vitripennis]
MRGLGRWCRGPELPDNSIKQGRASMRGGGVSFPDQISAASVLPLGVFSPMTSLEGAAAPGCRVVRPTSQLIAMLSSNPIIRSQRTAPRRAAPRLGSRRSDIRKCLRLMTGLITILTTLHVGSQLPTVMSPLGGVVTVTSEEKRFPTCHRYRLYGYRFAAVSVAELRRASVL